MYGGRGCQYELDSKQRQSLCAALVLLPPWTRGKKERPSTLVYHKPLLSTNMQGSPVEISLELGFFQYAVYTCGSPGRLLDSTVVSFNMLYISVVQLTECLSALRFPLIYCEHL